MTTSTVCVGSSGFFWLYTFFSVVFFSALNTFFCFAVQNFWECPNFWNRWHWLKPDFCLCVSTSIFRCSRWVNWKIGFSLFGKVINTRGNRCFVLILFILLADSGWKPNCSNSAFIYSVCTGSGVPLITAWRSFSDDIQFPFGCSIWQFCDRHPKFVD